MSTNPNPTGETKRVDASEASATIAGVPLFDWANFSIDIEDPSARERTTDNNTIHFDQLLNPSGSASVWPTSPAAASFFEVILARTITGATFSFPQEDARSSFTVKGCRLSNVSQDDLGNDGYQITADWEADFITG